MYRALAVIIHLNYLLLAKKTSCILIDDIGEGLDFERSTALSESAISWHLHPLAKTVYGPANLYVKY